MEDWLTRHAGQLEHLGVPEILWRSLSETLAGGASDIAHSLSWDCCAEAVCSNQDVAPLSQIWLVKHTLAATSGWQLLARLKNDFPLLMEVADNIQALSDSESDDESVTGVPSSSTLDTLLSDTDSAPASDSLAHPNTDQTLIGEVCEPAVTPLQIADTPASATQHAPDQAAADEAAQQPQPACSVHEQVLAAVRGQLHRHVFMCEAQGAGPDGSNIRVRYMLEPLLTRMPVSRDPHVHVMPFMYFPDHGPAQLMSIAWPVRELVCGQPLTRSRLPLGLADYAQQTFWQEAYRCETATDEWYGEMSEDVWEMLSRFVPGLKQPSALASGPATSGPPVNVLVAGCGNSQMGVELLAGGASNVVNIDYVQEVIDLMACKYAASAFPGLTWQQADLTDLHHTPDAWFDLVVDKATLDGMTTADAALQQRWAVAAVTGSPVAPCDSACVHQQAMAASPVTRYLHEMWRVVKPQGLLLLITLRTPGVLTDLLGQLCGHLGVADGEGQWCWQVEEHVQLQQAHAYMCRRA